MRQAKAFEKEGEISKNYAGGNIGWRIGNQALALNPKPAKV